MRAVADDVIRTLRTRCLAVLLVGALMAMRFTSTLPIDNMTAWPDPSNNGLDNESLVLHFRVVYICDKTADEFCGTDVTGVTFFSLLDSVLDYGSDFFNDCGENATCDSSNGTDSSKIGYHMDGKYVIVTKQVSDVASLQLNITFHVVGGSVRQRISEVDHIARAEQADVMVTIGDSLTVQTSAIVAEGQGIPALGYIAEYGDGPKFIQGATFSQLNPSPEAQGKALTQIIGQFNMKQTAVIVEDTRLADGFLSGVRNVIKLRRQDVFNVIALDMNIGNKALVQKLTELSNMGWKVIVLHCSPRLMLKVVTAALSTRLYNTGHAWFLSEMAFSRDPDVITQLPEGLLAIESFWLGGVKDVMLKAFNHLLDTLTSLYDRDDLGSDQLVPYATYNVTGRTRRQKDISGFRYSSLFAINFQRCLQASLCCWTNSTYEDDDGDGDDDLSTDDSEKVYIKGANVEEFFDEARQNQGPAFYLVNTVADDSGSRMWAKVGYITASGRRDLRTVLWPGHNIYGPSSSSVKTYRVVTRPAEPFVFVTDKVAKKEDCFVDVPCLKVDNSSQTLLAAVVDDFQSEMLAIGQLYTVHCCKGMILEILDSLSRNLNFKYVVYFVNDTNYGTNKDGNWTGMVGDVIDGTADIIAGAFSMTSERMTVLDFTEPFFQNEFSLVTSEGGNYVSIWAFMSPFSGQVWLCIMLSSIVAGIATAFLEWRSPFGLNPRGRKRTKNYGLGSGLLMVMVLLTGHTINIKAPKSWPGKVIQNVWAGLAIFIMTSYTANLAAYLAGQSAVSTVKSIFDPDLLTKRIAVIATSAVETYVEKINPALGKRARLNHVDSTETAINKLRERTVDVYLDDRPLLEYALARFDKSCKVRFAGKAFGSDGYAFGLSRHSWLKIPISNEILKYTESGFVQELGKKYLSRPQCELFLSGSANPYGLEHTGGLFIILVTAILFAVLLLVMEHLAYHFLVPWLRKQPPESFWKTENLAFISQRVFRVVRSERLYSQKQAAQEMITIVKQRDFTRLIQKNELQKRRATTQKRVKTKAEVFQEITANIVSYHRQLQSASETAENSEAEIDFEAASGDAHDATIDRCVMGVNNAAYAADNSDLTLDRFHLRRPSTSSTDACDDVAGSPVLGRAPRSGAESNGIRKLSSRSLGHHEIPTVDQRLRKKSDSYFLYPPCRPDTESYFLGYSNGSVASRFPDKLATYTEDLITVRKILDELPPERSVQPKKVDNAPPTNGDANHLDISECTNSENHPDSTSLPPSRGSEYYNSPTSSSVQSPIEEKREFSPLPSPASPGNESFPRCNESSGSLSTFSPDSSISLGPLAQESPHNESRDFIVYVTNLSPPNPSSTTANSASLEPDTLSMDVESTKKPDLTHSGKKTKIPRSASSDSVPRKLLQNNNHSLPHCSVPIDRERNGPFVDVVDSGSVCAGDVKDRTRSKQTMKAWRKMSDVGGLTGSDHLTNNTRAKYDMPRKDNYQRNLKLKDNRVKSTLRRHAMSGYQSHLPADFIDDCTLEALTKEDVLILWRKSELDLESRLHEVLAKNRRLSLAIDYLTRQEYSGEPDEV